MIYTSYLRPDQEMFLSPSKLNTTLFLSILDSIAYVSALSIAPIRIAWNCLCSFLHQWACFPLWHSWERSYHQWPKKKWVSTRTKKEDLVSPDTQFGGDQMLACPKETPVCHISRCIKNGVFWRVADLLQINLLWQKRPVLSNIRNGAIRPSNSAFSFI